MVHRAIAVVPLIALALIAHPASAGKPIPAGPGEATLREVAELQIVYLRKSLLRAYDTGGHRDEVWDGFVPRVVDELSRQLVKHPVFQYGRRLTKMHDDERLRKCRDPLVDFSRGLARSVSGDRRALAFYKRAAVGFTRHPYPNYIVGECNYRYAQLAKGSARRRASVDPMTVSQQQYNGGPGEGI